MPAPEQPPVRDAPYLFWARSAAVHARRCGRSREEVVDRVVRCFRDLCRAVEPTVVLELGAHQATFSRWAARTFPDARCLAVEANPHVHERHREKVAAAGVDYRHAAVADHTGTVTLNIPTEVHGKARSRTNRMASLAVHRASGGHESVEVPAVRVDELVDLGPQDRLVAWIDVEGASAQVLAGGREVLARASAVYLEVESRPTWEGQWLDVDVARYFAELGKIPVVRDAERRHQYNVVFLDPVLAAGVEVARRIGRVLTPPGKG